MSQEENSAVLVYDGDCEICCEWVRYWQHLTGNRVHYRPYQEACQDYTAIPLSDFKKSIQYIDADGTIRSGAAAAFALYQGIPLYRLAGRLYRHLPGFRLCSEFLYNFLSQHRGILSFITHLCWGRDSVPAGYGLTGWIFLRLLGCIYLAAFISFGIQITGLIGTHGVLPLDQYLAQLQAMAGNRAHWQLPMVFWFYLSDSFLRCVCIAGGILSCLLIVNIFSRAALGLLYLLYLSLYYAGQSFMTFQWDLLLLEAGFLAIFLTSGSRLVVWLYRWLVFRFMFLGGMVKIISHDPNWDNLTALNYHFETQPLPTLFAWYAHHLPQWLLMSATALTLVTEIILPFFIFAPRRLRMAVACCFIIFQSLIILTGNYNFFNLLTISLCVFLFDDAALKSCLPSWCSLRIQRHRLIEQPGKFSFPIVLLGAVILFSSTEQMLHVLGDTVNARFSIISRLISPWHFVQNYGPFAVMTTVRHEIVIEGSRDGLDWREYQFKFKPGDVSHSPRWATPHQPRLDWQMWFAALGDADRNPWFVNLLYQLLLNSRPVTALLATNPFPAAPPALIRARYYAYHFTSPAEKKANGNWWMRTLIGEYYPPVRLSMKVSRQTAPPQAAE